MSFEINPFLNYYWFEDGALAVWDNVAITKYKPEASSRIRHLLGHRIQAQDEGEIVDHRNQLVELLQKKHIVRHGIDDPSASVLAYDVLSILEAALPAWKVLVWHGDLNKIIIPDDSKYILLNPYTQIPVLGPVICRSRFDSLKMILQETWTTAAFVTEKSIGPTARVDRVALSQLAQAFAEKSPEDNTIYYLSEGKLAEKRLLMTLASPIELVTKQDFEQAEPIVYRENGYRITDGTELRANLAEYVDPVVGIIDESLRGSIANVRWVSSFSKLAVLLGGLHLGRHSMGKGVTADQAELSAHCEFYERYFSLIRRHDFPEKQSSFLDLKDPAVNPCRLQNWSEEQFAKPFHGKGDFFRRVPLRVTEATNLFWVSGVEYSSFKDVLLPADYCYYPLNRVHSNFFVTYSNGVASGRTYLEALLQGVLELIERDCAAIWWYRQIKLPARMPRSSFSKEVENFYTSRGLRFFLFDISMDFSVTTFAAVAFEEGTEGSLRLGFGSHIDPEIAETRSVTELAQFEAAAAAGKISKSFSKIGIPDSDSFLWAKEKVLQQRSPPKPSIKTTREALEHIYRDLASKGLDLYFFNYSVSGGPLKVVRAIVPGLRSFLFEMGPGRLFEVPEKLNLPRGSMNPTALDL